jgi:hypothetical protein
MVRQGFYQPRCSMPAMMRFRLFLAMQYDLTASAFLQGVGIVQQRACEPLSVLAVPAILQ